VLLRGFVVAVTGGLSAAARVARRMADTTSSTRGAVVKTLFILNDPPYGTERSYNALRLAGALAKRGGEELRVFLLGDAAGCAKSGQSVPQGFYNINRMLQFIVQKQVQVGVCATCMDARGIKEGDLIDGSKRGTLEELADWTVWAEKVVVF
jgi:uncharacterized protein involved in oxidation of intracellular sulfur